MNRLPAPKIRQYRIPVLFGTYKLGLLLYAKETRIPSG